MTIERSKNCDGTISYVNGRMGTGEPVLIARFDCKTCKFNKRYVANPERAKKMVVDFKINNCLKMLQ